MASLMKEFEASSHLFGTNAPFVEDLYERYLADPAAVPAEWRAQFDAWQQGGNGKDVPHAPIVAAFEGLARRAQAPAPTAGGDGKSLKVLQYIRAHRVLGSRYSQLDPLKRFERTPVPELELSYYGLTEADMDREFSPGSWQGSRASSPGPQAPMKLRDIVAAVKKTYCGTIGIEYMYISSTEQKRWIQQRFEATQSTPRFSADEKRWILERITASETLERYLHTRYVGQKRFSGEGGESMIPMLDTLIENAGAGGAREVVIGMAHRGRLNVLVNNLGKIPADLFSEFEGKHALELQSGDVKYHQGFSSDIKTAGGTVHLTLAFNPSHLEIVNPVVEGSVRARQHRRGDHTGDQVLPLLIHGDAAFAGQGVVMETLALSQTRGYKHRRHGAYRREQPDRLHHLGHARRALLALRTDMAKMVEAPVFHVNGDDPEACVMVAAIALEFRQRFHKDVVVDLGVLPAPRPQRAGRAVRDPAADVQEDRPAPGHAQALRRQARARGRDRPRPRRRAGDQRARRTRRGQGHQPEDPLRPQVRARDRLGAVHGRGLAPGGADRGAAREAQALRRAPHRHPVGLQAASVRRAPARRAPRDGRGQGAARLGHGGEPRLCVARRRRASGAPLRPGLRARHLRAPPCRAARPEPREVGRGRVHAAAEHPQRAGQLPRDRLAALGGGGARVRVRLRHRAALRAGDLGSAVRRLRQRRAGGDRPVHRVGRIEVGAPVRPHHVPAARLRGAGAGALLGAPRALPAALRRAQHPGLRAFQRGAVLPHDPPAGRAAHEEAPHRDDAQEPAAQEGGGFRRSPSSRAAASR